MSWADISLIIVITLVLINSLFLFLKGGKLVFNFKKKSHNIGRYIPLISVVLVILGIFGINLLIKKQMESNISIYEELLNRQFGEGVVLNEQKDKTLDSLTNYREKLIAAISIMQKQNYIGGENHLAFQQANSILNKTDAEINKIKNYNEVVDLKELEKIKKLNESESTSDTILSSFNCPTNVVSDFIELQFFLNDISLVEKIAFIYVQVKQKSYTSPIFFTEIFSQGYKPKKGVNVIGIQNYLKLPNINLSFGYILKDELNSENTTFRKITCKSIRMGLMKFPD